MHTNTVSQQKIQKKICRISYTESESKTKKAIMRKEMSQEMKGSRNGREGRKKE